MTFKRPRRDTAAADIPTVIRDTPESAMAVARYLVRQFRLDPAKLEEDVDFEHSGARVSLFKRTYQQVAPRVGLIPSKLLKDIGTFEIHRSRIPTDLFKSIVMDMDIMLMQFGPPFDHQTEEARSRFLSPVFNHLVKLFTFTLRNSPKTMIIGTQNYMEYFFQAFGAIAILVVEMQHKLDHERLEAIAHVIAECDGCDLDNRSLKISLPIHCIFINDGSFEFFKFERNPNPSIVRGCFPGDPMHLRRGVKMPDFTSMESSLPFVLQLRCICEMIFDVMLSAYIAGLMAHHNEEQEGLSRRRSLQLAEQALAVFREAECEREAGEIKLADVTVDQALFALQESTGAAPNFYKSRCIMKGWNDAEVGKG